MAEDSSFLAAVLDDHTVIGYVVWRDESGGVTRGAPKRRSQVLRYGIGIVLLPEYRSKGYGTGAREQLVDYLFATTAVYRVEASTEAGNLAEQRSLERVGFRREGLQRAAGCRNGQWVDGVLYGILRDDRRLRNSAGGAACERVASPVPRPDNRPDTAHPEEPPITGSVTCGLRLFAASIGIAFR